MTFIETQQKEAIRWLKSTGAYSNGISDVDTELLTERIITATAKHILESGLLEEVDAEKLTEWAQSRPDRYEDWKKEAYGHNTLARKVKKFISELIGE